MSIKRIAALVLAALTAAAMLSAPALALEADGNREYAGVDVSVYQAQIDFEAVRQSGIEVVYIRAGYGDEGVDHRFQDNARLAKEAGLHFGFYYYVTAKDEAQARAQAQFFARLIQGKGYDCRPAMDFESFSDLSRSQVNAIGLAFLQELERLTGVRPMLYSDAYHANTVWEEAMGAYPLWAAEYGPDVPEITSGHWDGWSGFQYSDRGRVHGIGPRVDLDRFTQTALLPEEETAHARSPEDTTIPEPAATREYTVRRGDTLWAIARRTGATVEELTVLNDLPDPNLIYVGQVLRLPTEQLQQVYTVQRGDTLWAIAQRYKTSVEALVRANAIQNPNLIFAGQTLQIPG
ncbi:MAG: LysM peptidoglycan-binding domain-containing protein [Clostridiales bacterium]|nr:LysM peptidoglycan-binding domain-containing protein [Clostridiales bacterium]